VKQRLSGISHVVLKVVQRFSRHSCCHLQDECLWRQGVPSYYTDIIGRWEAWLDEQTDWVL
jgi:hypothetical protein